MLSKPQKPDEARTRQDQRPQDRQRGVVLLVDDEPLVLDGLCDILRKDRHELLTATSGEVALTLLSQMKVDVLISDERMPSMPGHVLLERAKRDFPDVVRIMLTGQVSLDIAMQVINDGLYRYLDKPVEPEELRRVIRDALHVRALQLGKARN